MGVETDCFAPNVDVQNHKHDLAGTSQPMHDGLKRTFHQDDCVMLLAHFW